MAHGYRNWSPEQIALLPVNPRDWLDEDHLAFALLETVGQLDLKGLRMHRSLDGRGCAGYDPIMMTTLVLYGLLYQCVSSRGMARFFRNDLGARFLCGAAGVPEYRCIAIFRKNNQAVLAPLFAQSVYLCREADLIEPKVVHIDGSKFEANASTGKNVRYDKVDSKLAALELQFQELLAEADRLDEIEDEQEPPQDAQSRAKRLRERKERLIQAKGAMEDAARQAKSKWDATPSCERHHKDAPSGQPKPTDRANLTDLDSRLMKLANGGFAQAYNANIAVEASHQIIVGASLSTDCTDYAQLEPTLDSVEQTLGVRPNTVAADGGYLSQHNITLLENRSIEAIISPNRKLPPLDGATMPDEPESASDAQPVNCARADSAARQKMNQVFSTPAGRAIYAKRKYTVEPVFGQMKGSLGHPGMTGFLVRGFDNCRNHWLLACAVHNLGKLIRHKCKQKDTTDKGRLKRARASRNLVQTAHLVLDMVPS
jgi:transposase